MPLLPRRRKLTARWRPSNNRVNAVEAASRKLVFEVTLSEDQGNFAFGKTELPDAAKARLDQVVQQLKADTEEHLHRDRGPHRQRRIAR